MNILPRISPLQFFILCFTAGFGSSLTTLPRAVAEAAQEDMWLSVVIGGVAFLSAVWTAAKLAAYFPQCTCLEYHRILLGPVLGQMINILLVTIIALVVVVSTRTFVLAARMYLFDITPPEVIIFTFFLLWLYAAQYGLSPVIRLQQLVFASSHMMFLLVILVGLLAINTKHYLPLLANGLIPVLKGAIPSWYSYTGPEIMIGLLYPFITKPQKVFKCGAAAVAALIAVYTLLTLIVQGILGPKEAASILTPTILAYRSVEIPDTFIERIDGYFLIFWIPVFVVSMLNWLYLASFGIERILKLEYSRPAVVLLVPLLAYLTIVPPDFQTAAAFSQIINIAFIGWGLMVLPLLLALAWWQDKRRRAC